MLIDPRGYRIKRRIAKQITDRDKIPFTRLSGKFVLAQPLFRSCPFSRETPCVAIRLKGVENPLRRTHFRETYRSPEARAGALPALSIVYVAFLRPSISSAARLLPLPSTRFHLFVFLLRVLLLLPLFSFFFFVFCRLVFQRDLALWSPRGVSSSLATDSISVAFRLSPRHRHLVRQRNRLKRSDEPTLTSLRNDEMNCEGRKIRGSRVSCRVRRIRE